MAHVQWTEVEARGGVLGAWKKSGASIEAFAWARGPRLATTNDLRWSVPLSVDTAAVRCCRLRVNREEDEQVVTRLRAALEIYSPALHDGLRAALTERTFPPHPRFKQSAPPPLDDADALRGIHVIYCYPNWQVVIGGLSRAAAWKCGVRIPIDLRAKTPWDNDPDGEFVVDAVMRWVVDAWRACTTSRRTCAVSFPNTTEAR